MNASDFLALYGDAPRGTANELVQTWAYEAEVDRLLNEPVAGGVIVGDLLIGDGSIDQISPELRQACQSLMGDKADTYQEVRTLLLEKLRNGDRSVGGLINKIKGQVGENVFLDEMTKAGFSARLAESGSQEAWDVAIESVDGTTKYVQVKMYGNASGVVEHMKLVQAKVDAGVISDGNTIVHSVDFAVPHDIFEAVQVSATEIGYPGAIHAIASTSDDAADIVRAGFDNVGTDAIEHLFGELIGATLVTGALHMAANGFLLYKGAKNVDAFWNDTIERAAISGTAIGAAMTVESILNKIAFVGGIPTYALVLITTVATRGVLSRMARRGTYAAWIASRTDALNVQRLASRAGVTRCRSRLSS